MKRSAAEPDTVSIVIATSPGSRWLAALTPVDYVVVVPYPAAVEAIECVRPHFYCKGKEYANASNDVTGNITDDIATVAR
ncbi:MAG: hypothetical protein ACK44Y_12015, partial [Novosphingobium sp.]